MNRAMLIGDQGAAAEAQDFTHGIDGNRIIRGA
jgi:hypothetical protein